MNIAIIGLGLMGSSYAMALSKAGHTVYGIDRDPEAVRLALAKKWIQFGSTDLKKALEQASCIILCMYPNDVKSFLKTYNDHFQTGQIITDICGVKFLEETMDFQIKKAVYCPHHPMAGKEKSGGLYADDAIFQGANFLITPFSNTPSFAIDTLKRLAEEMGFGSITILSCSEHNRLIAYTSQLTHALAVALINSDPFINTKAFIGDSYRDLTRIAMINETLWSELFLENRTFLTEHIDRFSAELQKIKTALINQDEEQLKTLFRQSTEKRKEMEQ